MQAYFGQGAEQRMLRGRYACNRCRTVPSGGKCGGRSFGGEGRGQRLFFVVWANRSRGRELKNGSAALLEIRNGTPCLFAQTCVNDDYATSVCQSAFDAAGLFFHDTPFFETFRSEY